jgi:hypothetical protein
MHVSIVAILLRTNPFAPEEIGETFGLAACFLLGVGIFLGSLALSAALGWRELEPRARRFRQMAEARDGEFHPPKFNFVQHQQPGFTRSVGAVQVVFSMGLGVSRKRMPLLQPFGRQAMTTRASAFYALATGPDLTVIDKSAVLLGERWWIDGEKVSIGDADFDRDFVVSATNPSAARVALSHLVRATLLERLAGAHLQARNGVVTLTMSGGDHTVAVLDAMAEVVGAIASYGVAFLHTYASLEHASLEAVADARTKQVPTISIGGDEIDVTIGLKGDQGGLYTVAFCAHAAREWAGSVVRIDEHGTPDLAPPGLATEEGLTHLAAVGPAELRFEDDRAMIAWPDVAPSSRVAHGVKLLRALARGVQAAGAFR